MTAPQKRRRESSKDPDKLFHGNLRYFEKNHPGIAHYVSNVRDPLSKIVWEDGRAVDIDLGSGRLYKKPASEFAREQLDAYFAHPERVVLNQPEGANMKSVYSMRMLRHMLNEVGGKRKVEMLGQSKDNIGFLILIGVGLGLHVEELIKKTKARTVIIVEPIAELLRHSLSVIDWAAIGRWCKKRGISMIFTTWSSPDKIAGQINSLIYKHGRYRMDGSYIFTHYSTFVTNEVRNKVKEAAPYLLVIKGWFEDEIDMLLNSSGNYFNHPFRLVDADPLPQRDAPAFVVASGPSLDRSIEVIRKWQGHAVIFSSGSSLQALLHHGIVPDYHVELENVPAVEDMLKHILDLNKDRFPEGRFTGLKLVASSTVQASVPPMFDEAYLYIRDTVSSSMTFTPEYRHVYYAGPNVSNTSACLAALMGFRDMYFFGCDCGWRSSEHHHSKATAYYTSDKFISGSSDQNKESAYKYPGNFGGMINTDILFNWNREFIESVIGLYKLRAFNCSDGVLINGAAPTYPDSVHFDGPPLDKEAVFRTVRQGTPSFLPGEFLRNHDLDAYVAQCDDFVTAWSEFLETARNECKMPEDFYDQLMDRLEEWKQSLPGPARVVEGSVVGIPMVGLYFFNRIEDPELRLEIFRGFLDKFDELFKEMAERSRELFEGIADRGREAKKKIEQRHGALVASR